VKRRDLERHLRQHGAQLIREGGNREIDYRLARKICADLEIPPPRGSR
jgi:hypothetical protein